MNKYRLKDDVKFTIVNMKSIKQFDFDLSDYYDKKTRIFEFPQGYIAFHLMGQVFNDFLIPLNLVEEVNDDTRRN